jgi:inward rectifier potassium channel
MVFSNVAVIAPYAGGRSLQFRLTNRRRNQIMQLEAQVLFSYLASDGAGRQVRRYELLPLERNKVTFLPLSWTIVHPIDEASPLGMRTPEDLAREQAEVLVLVSGVDETFAQIVHARSSYRADEIIANARFRSMFLTDPQGGVVGVDVTRLHAIEPLDRG